VRKIHYSEKQPYRFFARIKEILTARRKLLLLLLLEHNKSLQIILITLEEKAHLEYSSVARMEGKPKLLTLDFCTEA
jgi:hypothetical protein